MTGIAKKAAAILGGAFAVQKGFDFLKDSVAAARESNAVAAQTAAAIKSTGGAAHVTAAQVDELANSIARKTGIDDEQIGKAENLLLTFTNVRNEAGKGNDIFNQSTKILADMGKALGTDASGAAIQLGKALNDPIAGISALTRVGVTFNDGQKEQIKTLVEHGKTAEAQKIILAELSKEFGGSAEAQATAADKLKVTLGNLQEQIGNKLIPVIDAAAGFLADHLPGALDAAGRAFNRIKTALQPVIDGVRLFVNAFRTGFTEDEGTPIERLALKARELAEAFQEHVLPVIQKVVSFVQDNLTPILLTAGAAFLVITSPVTAVIAALVLLYARFQPVRDAIDFLIAQIGNLAEAFSTRFAAIQEAVSHVMNAIRDVISVALVPILQLWQLWGDQIMAIVGIVFSQIQLIISTAVRVIRDIIDVVLAVINGDWGAAWNALKDIPAAALSYIVGTIQNVFGVMKQVVSAGLAAIVGFFGELPGRLGALAGAIGAAGLRIGKSIIDGISHGLSSAAGFAGDIASAVLRAIKHVINTQVIDRINAGIPDSLGAGPFKINLPPNPVPHLARGAIVHARPGGVLANIAEGGTDEAVVPLPPGVIEGLQAIAQMAQNRIGGEAGALVGQIVFEGIASLEAAEANASALIRRLRAEAFVQGK